jgi:hypothetical protein
MEYLVWIGTAVALAGVGGLLWCVGQGLAARKSGAPGEDLRARLQKLVALNLAALGVSSLGLMLVVAGIMLG